MTNDSELEAQIRADPDDLASHLVYADWLQSQGDPHGELIVLQHELATKPTPALAKREQKWFRDHFFEVPDYYKLTWRTGYVRSATLHTRVGYLRHAVAFLKAPSFKFLRELRIEGSAAGAFAISSDLPKELRSLVVTTREPIHGATVGEVVAHLPNLERIELATRANFEGPIKIASPMLEEIGVSSGYGKVTLAATTPKLRALSIVADDVAVATRNAAFERTWPLTRLGLFARDALDIPMRLVRAPVWPHLEAVGLELAVEQLDAILGALENRALLPNPTWRGYTLYAFGQALRDRKRFADALRCFELGVVESPYDADMWLEHGNTLDDVGRTAESLASYERAVELDGDNAAVRYTIACWYRDAGDHAKALGAIRHASKLAPDDGATWHVRGQLEAASGVAATKSLKRALAIYTRDTPGAAPTAETTFQIACVRNLLGERDACLAALATAIALDPAIKPMARGDRDLAALRTDPDFVRLVA